MKRFEFSLERVLQLKKQREKMAELHQQQCRLTLDRAQDEVRQLEEQLARFADPRSVLSLLDRQEQAAVLAEEVDRAEARVTQARLKFEEASRLRTKVATEVEALAHLRREQWQAYRRQAAQVRQDQVDEQSLQRWLQNQAARVDG